MIPPFKNSVILTQLRLLAQIRSTLQMNHYTPRNEESFISWIKKDIVFRHKQHLVERRENEMDAFLRDMVTNVKFQYFTLYNF
jgi:hypothetical protein